jgi:hypothetical protein
MPDPMEDLRKLSAEARAGPWKVHAAKLHGFDVHVVNPGGDAELGNWLVAGVRWEANAALIVAAVNLVRALTDEGAVERAARALCREQGEDPDRDDYGAPAWLQWKSDARAALSALIEASE